MSGFKYKLYRFMQGRRGLDNLGRFLIMTAMILMIVSMFLIKFPTVYRVAYYIGVDVYKRQFLVIENMIVDGADRRKGVGRVLLSEMEKQAKEWDCTQMILVTEIGRRDACCFYEAFGFHKNNKGYKKKL